MVRRRIKPGRPAVKRRTAPDKTLRGQAVSQRRRLLDMEIRLTSTFIRIALAAFDAGSLEHARQAARDAQTGYRGAQKQLRGLVLARHERRKMTQRLKDLKQRLAEMHARERSAVTRRPS